MDDLSFLQSAQPLNEVERRRSDIERTNENSARLAQAFAKYTSTGLGYVEFEAAVDFGLTFLEEPFPAYGCYIDVDDYADLIDLEPGDTPPLPICTGFVTDWDLDTNDFYTGCWVAARVYVPPDFVTDVPEDTPVEITHYFTFSGKALKDIPPDVRD